MKKENRGGKRVNAGRKKSDVETTTIAFRVRRKGVDELKRKIKILIKKHEEK